MLVLLTYLAARDFKPRGSASVKDILSHVAIIKIIKKMKGGDHMSYREHVSSNDEAIFNRTAIKTKRINLVAVPTRGGIRL